MSVDDEPKVIGVGASAGGVEALFSLVSALPPDLPAAMLVVLHRSAGASSVLADLLARRCALPVVTARDGDTVEPGRVYVAPPDRHLLTDPGRRLAVTQGPKENGHRPGIDALLRSLALEHGPRGIGVVLSGMLDDGAVGMLAVVRHGGTAVVQEPGDALFPQMPRAALRQVPGAVTASADELAGRLVEVVGRPVIGGHGPSRQLAYEVAVARNDADEITAGDPPGPPAGLSCPDCSGPLFDLSESSMLHYRCRVGHSWSELSLDAEHDDRVEAAMYMALQALEEKAVLQHRIAARATEHGSARVAVRARDAAHDALASAAHLRQLLTTARDGEPR